MNTNLDRLLTQQLNDISRAQNMVIILENAKNKLHNILLSLHPLRKYTRGVDVSPGYNLELTHGCICFIP